MSDPDPTAGAADRPRYPDPMDPDLAPDLRRPRPWPRPGILAAVGVGGVLGACTRYEVDLALPTRAGTFPLSTFLINVTGSFALGVLLTFMVERWPPRKYLRPLVATGFIGAYTTWSTFMVDADDLLKAGHVATAAAYLAASLAGGLVAVTAGMRLARSRPPALWSRRRPEPDRRG